MDSQTRKVLMTALDRVADDVVEHFRGKGIADAKLVFTFAAEIGGMVSEPLRITAHLTPPLATEDDRR